MAAVVEDIIERRLKVLTVERDELDPPVNNWDDVVDLVWGELQSPPFTAALELWAAARTDPDLLEALLPLQERIFATVHHSVIRLSGAAHARPHRKSTRLISRPQYAPRMPSSA